MKTDLTNFCNWERKKAIFLMNFAENTLAWDLSGYGEIGVNKNSGYTYLWLEDHVFCIYMPIYCELQNSDIYALYTDLQTGEEYEVSCENVFSVDDIIEKFEDELNINIY